MADDEAPILETFSLEPQNSKYSYASSSPPGTAETYNTNEETNDVNEKMLSDMQDTGRGTLLPATWACCFLYGELAGSGVFVMPTGIFEAGFLGVLVIVVSCGVSAYTGYLLGQSWIIVQTRYKEFRGHVRHPYPTVGNITYGAFGRISISLSSNFSMLGSCVVILVFTAQNIHRLLDNIFNVQFPFCIIMVIIAVCLTPITWFGTPKDFWVLALGASASSTFAGIILWIVMAMDYTKQSKHAIQPIPDDPIEFFQGVGSMMLALGGHFAFLTIQNDMAKPSYFKYSLIVSYIGLAAVYIPTATLGYVVYGSSVNSNLLLSLSPGVLSNIVLLLVTFHMLNSFTIIINPCLQHLEETININKNFSFKRVLIRTLVVMSLLFVAETVPNFSAIVSFIGGATYIYNMFIAPTAIYYKLCSMKGDWEPVHIPLHVKVLLLEVFIIGWVIAVGATYSSFITLWGSSDFTVPCYVDMGVAGG